jgi:hypothetical protein
MVLASAPLRERLAEAARAQARTRFSGTRFRTAMLDIYGVQADRLPRRLRTTAAPATLA